jgi:hypothetical protein
MSFKSDKNNGCFTWHSIHIFELSRSVLLRMRNFSDKICKENKDALFNNVFFENRAVYKLMWKNTVEGGWTQMIIWRMCIACWITKASHSQYVILTALLLQQWFHESTSLLHSYVQFLFY